MAPVLTEQGQVALLTGLSVICLALAWVIAFPWSVHRCILLVIIGWSTLCFAVSRHIRLKGILHFLPAEAIDALFNKNLATVAQEFARYLNEPTGFGQFLALACLPMDAAGVRATINAMPADKRSIMATRGLKNLLSPQAQAWLFPRFPEQFIEDAPPKSSSRGGAPITLITPALEPPSISVEEVSPILDMARKGATYVNRREEPQPPSPDRRSPSPSERGGLASADGWDVPEEDWIDLPSHDEAVPVSGSASDAGSQIMKYMVDYWSARSSANFVNNVVVNTVNSKLRNLPLVGHFLDSHPATIVWGTLAGSTALTLTATMAYSPYARKWGARWRHFIGDMAMFGAASLAVSFTVLSLGSVVRSSSSAMPAPDRRRVGQAHLTLLQRVAASPRTRALLALAIFALWVTRLRRARLRHLLALSKDLLANPKNFLTGYRK
jgi:hypothetical protein